MDKTDYVGKVFDTSLIPVTSMAFFEFLEAKALKGYGMCEKLSWFRLDNRNEAKIYFLEANKKMVEQEKRLPQLVAHPEFPWPCYTAKGSPSTYQNCVVKALQGFNWAVVRNSSFRDWLVTEVMKAPACMMHPDDYVPNKCKLAGQVVGQIQKLAKQGDAALYEGLPRYGAAA